MSKYLGIDASTQSMTALIIDVEESPCIAVEESVIFDDHFRDRYGVENGALDLGGGQVHSPPLMWVEALDLLLANLRDNGHDLARLRAIAGSGQQHGTVYLNQAAGPALARLDPSRSLADQLAGVFSRPTSPIWMDTSTTAECRQIEAAAGGRLPLLKLTGNTAFERFSGPQIRKFSQSDPEGYSRTDNIGLVSSFVASLLAGRLVPVDAGDGSGTNLLDIRRRQWAPEALQATAPELARRLLPVTPSTRAIGEISTYFAQRYGFSPTCRVFPFSGDNPCSLIGLGLVEPGSVALSLGTSDTLFACMDQVRVSDSGEGAVFCSPDDVNYMALICFLNGSLAREAVRDQYGLDWEQFAQALRDTPPGNGGALMLPYFAAEIVPHVPEPGVVRQNLDAADANANVRAVIEAQALSSRLHSAWMDVPVTSLSVTGGASANEEILRVYANVHGCPAHRFQTTNSAALGAALRAWHGCAGESGEKPIGWPETVEPFTRPQTTIQPDPAGSGVYSRMLAAYESLERRATAG